VYTEQRAVADGEIYAVAVMRGRFLKRSGGTATMAEISAATGIDTAGLSVPAWVTRWASDVALPGTREAAPSTWD
jgi:hypothetical protein